MTLEYTPSTSLDPASESIVGYAGRASPAQSVHQAKVADVTKIKESWTSEQINDFVRKLGFLDTGREEERDQIKLFLHINEVCV